MACRINEEALIIGFARRFAPYKRSHLILHDLKRLKKILNNSKRPVQLIFAGKVEVNGEVERIPQTMVTPGEDEFKVDGAVVSGAESKIIYVLNKPKNAICSSQPIGTKKLVVDLFQKDRRRLFTVGRLDRDTTGLLFVTNDGHFANRVIHPSAKIIKEYLVRVDREVNEEDLIVMRQGVWIDGKKVRPVRVRS